MKTKANKKESAEVKKVVCWPSPGCHDMCGVVVSVKDGRVVKIKGSRQTMNGKRLFQSCPEKLPHLIDWLYHPEQLMYPLKRTGERGGEQMGKSLVRSGIG